jgi:hypothetical protein
MNPGICLQSRLVSPYLCIPCYQTKKIQKKGMIDDWGYIPEQKSPTIFMSSIYGRGTHLNVVTKQLLFVFSRVLLCLLSLFSAFSVSFFHATFFSVGRHYSISYFFHELAKLEVVTANFFMIE